MKTPLFLMGAALLFWGWQTGFWVPAVLMALVLEGSRFIKSRLDLSSKDFNRISDMCSLLLAGVAIWLFFQSRSAHAILSILQWLPLVFSPLVAAQIYSTSEGVPIGAFFWTFRKRSARSDARGRKGLNLSYPFSALCILSASAANVRTIWFYACVFSLTSWALFSERSRRFRLSLWVALFLSPGFMGYAGHLGFHRLQVTLEKKALNWFSHFIREDADPNKSRTAIGEIGTLKNSDRIVFRVKPGFNPEGPMLLRESSYNVYRSGAWYASKSHFKTIRPEKDGATWKIQSRPEIGYRMTVSTYLNKGRGVLTLPQGAYEIARLPVLKMESNQFGAVKVDGGPGVISYQALFHAGISPAHPPGETDLTVPQREKEAILKI
ncbi:MAG: transglutaminase domain-containing protein, partial [Pseudomonadota bacterium]